MTVIEFHDENLYNPLDLIERIIEYNNWVFDRRNDCEISVQVPSNWSEYNLYFTWNNTISALHLSCAFDMRVPEKRQHLIYELLANINEQLWLGYFGMWKNEGVPMFRHAIPLRGNTMPTIEQMEDLVDTALYECDRFFPAFQYVIGEGKSPSYAMKAAMIKTCGEA